MPRRHTSHLRRRRRENPLARFLARGRMLAHALRLPHVVDRHPGQIQGWDERKRKGDGNVTLAIAKETTQGRDAHGGSSASGS